MLPLLELKNISKDYGCSERLTGKEDSDFHVLRNVNFAINPGESIGLIGESGCGKTTLAKIAAGLVNPTQGQVLYSGKNIKSFNFEDMQRVRKDVQIIFQSSQSIFNPYHTIGKSLRQALENFEKLSKNEMEKRITAILDKVGLDSSFALRYPEKLSGGQRQRANIARALIVQPRLIICDEPVASLDFSIRKKTLDMLKGLIQEMSLTCLFISHDISTVYYTCQKVAVMYQGVMLEWFPLTPDRHLGPVHPYSRSLLDCVPVSHPARRIKGREKRLAEPEQKVLFRKGCVFYERCPHSQPGCGKQAPALQPLAEGHFVACHRYHLQENISVQQVVL
ncbi:ABC transporter ATP-binding protein [Aminipila butyrica]|uniref:ABC transporter ATP-binding protein n=1 Tax=Aminipila butyrica TaxID=433296 RepID=A0A858BSJ4_9FIRM|nr:ABC transporter ATP-binding protein [Aminipila butyrica]QIB68075.1 ABC transporter ATP-binding protein [Aminipila butyrica]